MTCHGAASRKLCVAYHRQNGRCIGSAMLPPPSPPPDSRLIDSSGGPVRMALAIFEGGGPRSAG